MKFFSQFIVLYQKGSIREDDVFAINNVQRSALRDSFVPSHVEIDRTACNAGQDNIRSRCCINFDRFFYCWWWIFGNKQKFNFNEI